MNIGNVQEIAQRDGIIFLTYGGFLSQPIIAGMTEALEKEAEASDLNMGIASNIFTIFIELSQNMMNYSKDELEGSRDVDPTGIVVVTKSHNDSVYHIYSQNIVSIDDKTKMEPSLNEVVSLDRDSIKKRYKELRRSGKGTHAKGGGIGFFEIAKRSTSVEFNFKKINEDKYHFSFESIINTVK